MVYLCHYFLQAQYKKTSFRVLVSVFMPCSECNLSPCDKFDLFPGDRFNFPSKELFKLPPGDAFNLFPCDKFNFPEKSFNLPPPLLPSFCIPRS